MSTLKRETARVFKPLYVPIRYKAIYGGRGSGKSHDRAEALVEEHILNPGLDSVCIREVQKSLANSSKKLIEQKIQSMGVGSYFEVQTTLIRTPGGGQIVFQGMQDHTAESIKSLEGFGRAWVEEAQTLSERSLELLRPTIRDEGSELWFTWNPRRQTDAVDNFFRGAELPERTVMVNSNWRDNPWFTDELEFERTTDQRNRPSRYKHVWDGEYEASPEDAMVKRHWIKLVDDFPRNVGNVCRYWDLAGTEAKANSDPDFTAGALLMAHNGQYYLIGMEHFRETPLGNENRIKSTADLDGRNVPIWLQKDPGQAGKAQIDHYSRNVLQGYAFRGHDKGKQSKMAMADPFAAACEAGNFHIVRKTHDGYGLTPRQIETLLSEIEMFPDSGDHDDQVDAITGAYNRLTTTPRQVRRSRPKIMIQ